MVNNREAEAKLFGLNPGAANLTSLYSCFLISTI